MIKPLRIALTKGRLEKKSIELFEKAGYDCREVKSPGRKLQLNMDGIEVVLAKASDVVTYVERGVCDLGIVGKDTIMENGGSYFEVLDFGFGKCNFALAAKKNSDFFKTFQDRRVATKYVKVAKNYFDKKGMDVEIIQIDGSVELAPLLGLAVAIVDIVETGDTLRENGLEIIETIAPVSARLITNIGAMKTRRLEVTEIIKRLEACL